jgi:DNA primase catalytic core
MQVTKEGIERIKSANELARVVAERGIELKRRGKTLVGLCPFHKEKTPSFTITPSKGLFHCFGCGVSGDVIHFVSKQDGVPFSRALERLSERAGLSLEQVMAEQSSSSSKVSTASTERVNGQGAQPVNRAELLGRVVEHYHRSFCEREDAQGYLKKRGLADPELLRSFKVGYADGSLLKRVGKQGEVREELLALGVITAEGRELLGGCIVVPIPDPLTGQWTNLYGRGMKVQRHCYLPGPLRGVLNYQAARLSSEVILTESILDALSFHQVGLNMAIPIYGTNGFTAEHLDLLQREQVKQVVLALDNDEPGRKATEAIAGVLAAVLRDGGAGKLVS